MDCPYASRQTALCKRIHRIKYSIMRSFYQPGQYLGPIQLRWIGLAMRRLNDHACLWYSPTSRQIGRQSEGGMPAHAVYKASLLIAHPMALMPRSPSPPTLHISFPGLWLEAAFAYAWNSIPFYCTQTDTNCMYSACENAQVGVCG